MASPVATSAGKPTYVGLNVRQVFETSSVEDVKDISKKVNHEIDRKREELRMLVGERYRDLIDAADTIGTMKTTSLSVFEKLTVLREKLNKLPKQLHPVKVPKQLNNQKRLNHEELEISVELKLSLETPRQIQFLLDKRQIIPALHLYLFFKKNLSQISKPYQWTFLANSGYNSIEITSNIEESLLQTCHETFDDFESSAQRLTECMIVKQVMKTMSCEAILSEVLERRLQKLKGCLVEKDPDFVTNIGITAEIIYAIFIHPQIYSNVLKDVKKPNIIVDDFGLKFVPKSVQSFNQETIHVEEPLRVSQLAEVVKKSFVTPLKEGIENCYDEYDFMCDFTTFKQLHEYQQDTCKVLKNRADELMKVVLGTANNLWAEAFSSTFQRKCRKISHNWIENTMRILDEDLFPKYQKLDDQFDLVAFVWKPPSMNEKSSCHSDVDLKLKWLSPPIAELCSELELKFQEILKDFLSLRDPVVKSFLSSLISDEILKFTEKQKSLGNTLFLGRFCTALIELCPPLWKLVEKQESTKLQTSLTLVCQSSFTVKIDEIMDTFVNELENKMENLSTTSIVSLMPVGEDFIPQKDEEVKPSIRIPFQLSHNLHTLLFGISVKLATMGPQSVPNLVRENLRQGLGIRIMQVYKKLVEGTTNNEDWNIPAQLAVQLIFDLKYCQWFHPKLSEESEPIVLKLQSFIDPFDLDIVIPKLKSNLKRFLFETHLTLGLLLSEESHSFIAQNFKTKQNQSYPIANAALSSPLPLLPI